MTEKKPFLFLITYYKASGKYYSSCIEEWEVQCVSSDEPYVHHAVAKLRGMMGSGHSLPGMQGTNWEGFITIQRAKSFKGGHEPDYCYPDGVPHLLIGNKYCNTFFLRRHQRHERENV